MVWQSIDISPGALMPLAFGLVSPMFLWAGAGLMSIPIIIHILNRRRFRVVVWAAMEFLLKAMRKNRRRIRFEQWLLLATRCLLLLLVGLALSRPLGCQDTSIADLAGRRSGLHVFVINNSLSMAYQADRPGAKTHLDQAKLIAKAMIQRLSSGGESVAIVTASKPAAALFPAPIYDLDAAEAAVDRIRQSCSDIDEAGALAKARDIAVAETKQANKSLYLIDDSNRAGWSGDPDAIKQTAHELSGLYKAGIAHFNLGKNDQWNQAVVDLPPSQFLLTNWFDSDFTADVRAYGPGSGDPRLSWKWDDDLLDADRPIKATDAKSPQTLAYRPRTGGIHVLTASIQSFDRLPIDNARSRVVNVANSLPVLIVEGERALPGLGSSGAFLDTALNPSLTGGDTDPGKKSSYVATERISDLEFGNKQLTDYRCICLCGVGNIQEPQAAQLEQYVKQGGTLMVFMGDPVTADNYNAVMLKHRLLPGALTRLVTMSGEQPARHFDFDPHAVPHPILSLFAGQDNSGLNSAEIYKYWQVDLPANSKAERVLNFQPADKDQKGDPAITVHSLGNGRVLFYATAADPGSEWTTFMAHEAYPALMHMLLLGTVNTGDTWMNLTVNQPAVIPPWVHVTEAPSLKDPNQVDIPIELGSDNVYRSKALTQPGVYSLSTGSQPYKIAVNSPPDASDVRTIDDSTLKKDLGDIDLRLEGDSVPVQAAQAHPGIDFGWSVMIVVLALLACEGAMAMRFGHHWRK